MESQTINLTRDRSAAPGDVVISHGELVPILRIVAHGPGAHPPIREDLHAVELVTEHGSRWVGSESAPYIGSDLRMHWGA